MDRIVGTTPNIYKGLFFKKYQKRFNQMRF
jgi:hypothetical protein